MYTTVIGQLHVQMLLDSSAVHVIILILEMEKRAASFEVNVVLSSSQFYSVL